MENDCIVCGVETEVGYNVCLNCKDKRNIVTVGIKSPSFYVTKIINLGQYHDKIIVKTLHNQLEIVNRIIKPTLYFWGLDEVGRREKRKEKAMDGNIVESYYIHFEMIPPLRGRKTDARRKGIF